VAGDCFPLPYRLAYLLMGSSYFRVPSGYLLATVIITSLLAGSSSAWSKCRDLIVARSFGAVAHAAQPDVTIQYFGHNFFLLTTKKGTAIVTDPLGPGRYPTPNIESDVITIGREHYNHNYVEIIGGNPLILRGLTPSGWEWNKINTSFKDVFIYNVPIYHYAGSVDTIKGAAFVFDLGELCIAHLGDLSQPLTPEQIKMLGKVDVALTPIGGWRTMAPDLAREVLQQLKPKIVIPMHYRDPYVIEEFTEGLDAEYLETDTLVVSKDSLPSSMQIRVLQFGQGFSFE